MKLLISYANTAFKASQRANAASGLQVGGFDRVRACGPADLDAAFQRAHQQILSGERGNGYWLWKPYLIDRALGDLADGDYLFYSDAGAHFIGSIDPLVELSRRTGDDLMAFELHGHLEKHWTKRDAFILTGTDRPEFTDTRQRLASFSLWRKSAFTVAFAREFLAFCCDARILTDQANACGQDNYPGFIGHRHDQSVFSLLTKIHRLPAYRDPSQWGNEVSSHYPDSTYPQLISHTRMRKQSPLRRLTTRLISVSQWPFRPRELR